jgi:hypothetical protein
MRRTTPDTTARLRSRRIALRAVLAVSLLGNLAAVVVWTTRSRPEPAPQGTPTRTADESSPVAAARDSRGSALSAPAPAASSLPLPAPGERPDAAFVARLRAEGFPTDVIRAIVRRQVDEHFAGREAAIRAAYPDPPYWSSRQTMDVRRASGPARVALRQQKNGLLRALLGADAESPEERAARERNYGSIPIDKVEDLVALDSEFAALTQEWRESTRGAQLPGDREQFVALRTERQRAIAELLTPEERAIYELRSGDVANNLRNRLEAFNPSESEFLALHALQAEFERTHSASPPGTRPPAGQVRAAANARAAATAQLETQIAATLGPERYAEYQLTTSSTYRNMRRITDRLELAPVLAATMTRSLDAVTRELDALAADASLSDAQRVARVEALQTQAREQLAGSLPGAALQEFERALGNQVQSRLRRGRPSQRPGAN